MTERRLDNVRYVIRSDLARRVAGNVKCPLGIFTSEAKAVLREGFEARYQTSEDEFGDQYEYRLLLSADRLHAGVRMLFEELLPEEVHALYEEFSMDAYRDTDAYMSDDLVAVDRVMTAWDNFGHFLIEDVKCGFGAMSYDPSIEIFVEEHGSIFVACSLTMKSRVEKCLDRLGLKQTESLPTIENFRHQHRDVLIVDPNDADLMDEVDIKFSIIESFGMKPSNLHEGEPAPTPALFWASLELDMSFVRRAPAPTASLVIGFTADDHDDAMRQIDEEVLKTKGALVSRIVDLYRVTEEDLNDEVAPRDRTDLTRRGIWYRSPIQY